MRLFRPALLLIAALAALPAIARAQVTRDPAKIEAGTYHTDPDHTQVMFGVNHFGFSMYYGRFALPTGTLTLEPRTPAASTLDITIPTATVSTPSDKLTGELKSADWLDAGQFPTITFHSVSVKPTGAGKADVTGNLTLHGVTKPVTLHVTLIGAGPNPFFKVYTVGFSATGSLKRSEFGVSKYVPAVGDEVTLILSGAFVKS
jgi:polyisoprenoid-binding protein YceI